ncbi:MAG TPA: nucleoside deaminase [Puia sp.]|nr:nucleoside deaminase [Puia sp.]
MITEQDREYLQQAIALARRGVEEGRGGPFGCVIVREGEVVGKGNNGVTSTNDPTAHAEIVAIRDACSRLGHFQLTGCVVYASCEPCPMCLGAIYWARPSRVVYAATRQQAAAAGFDDEFIYREIEVPEGERKIVFELGWDKGAEDVFELWRERGDRSLY